MKHLRTITRVWLGVVAAGVALAAIGLPEAAQDVARRAVDDAWAGNPWAMALLIVVLVLGGLLWVAERMVGLWAKTRGRKSPAAGQDEHQGLHAHLRRIEQGQAEIRAGQIESRSELARVGGELEALRRDVDRLYREREA